MDLNKLKEPFAPSDIKWRIGQAGKKQGGDVWAKVLAYVDNRLIQDRLDEVCGPANWRNEYQFVEGGVLCGISIMIDAPDRGEPYWLTKWDGADPSDIESFKGALSDSMKRAAVQWGIARELYEMGENWAEIVPQGTKDARYANSKVKVQGKEEYVQFYWLPPTRKLADSKAKAKKNGKPDDDLPPIPTKAEGGPGDEERYIKLLTFIADCQDKEVHGVFKTRQQRLTDLRYELMGKNNPYPNLSAQEKKNLGTLIDKAVADIECSQQPEFTR